MTDKTLGVLIHGAGWVATQHIAACVKNPHTRVVAISSRKLTSASKRAEEAGLKDIGLYDDLDKALQHEGVDIVCVCTPQHVHCENVLAAAAAGKHLVIEKPAANSLEELRRMHDAVKRAGVKTIVSFVLRWNPMFQNVKRLVAEGKLGELYCVETDYQSYNSDWWGGWEDGRRVDTGVSAMAVAGCHAIDALRWFAAPGEFEAADPVEVFAYAGGRRKGATRQFNPLENQWHDGTPLEYDGLEIALVKFSNGVVGKVSVNFECNLMRSLWRYLATKRPSRTIGCIDLTTRKSKDGLRFPASLPILPTYRTIPFRVKSTTSSSACKTTSSRTAIWPMP